VVLPKIRFRQCGFAKMDLQGVAHLLEVSSYNFSVWICTGNGRWKITKIVVNRRKHSRWKNKNVKNIR
jgi:hypothetical protein